MRRLTTVLAATTTAMVLAAACSTASDSTKSPTTTQPANGGGGELTASARGVTASTIKIGFSYIDLETLAKSGIIKISHGPYAQIIKTLVDDVNASGGINGRKLELVTAKFSPIGSAEQLAACTKMTEDDQVFAVLNGLLNENNLCIVQQHGTILVNGASFNAATLAKAQAPWATYLARDERRIAALAKLLDANKALTGHKFALYAAQAANKPLLDLAERAFTELGHEPTDSVLLDVPDNDTQGASAQNKVFAQRLQDKGVDTIVDVGLAIPGADFDAAGYHPRIYTLDAGNIAAAAFTNPFAKFPIVAGLGASADPDELYNGAEFTRCRDVYEKATGKKIQTQQQEDIAGTSTGFVAMSIACTDMQIFVAAAKAAGPNLTNESFAKGLASLGKIALANTPAASFGPDKSDAQDSFVLAQFDPAWKEGQGKLQFAQVGDAVTVTK